MKKTALLLVFVITFNFIAKAQQHIPFVETLQNPNRWVDSVFKKMNRNEKIAQLFMVRAHTNLGKAYEDSVAKVIKKQHLGGVVFFQGGPVRQAILTNRYQSLSKVPLMIALDGEWGLGMRLDSTISYPYQMTLGAIQNNHLLYQMGQEVASDFKRMGMQINFAPDMDVNNNPKNPVINFRSFGDNKYNVAAKGIQYFQGMQDAGLFTTAKHFPGHGDTDVDSHLDLPQLNFTPTRLDTLEMYPFKQAFAAGLSGIMIAHMDIPALDSTAHLPSTLSKPIVTGILKDKLGFKGLVFSDAMGMKGVVKYFPNGEADVRGVMAGMDVLELSENSKRGIKLIRKSIRHHRLNWDDIDQKVKKILKAKYWMGLNQLKPVDTTNLITDLNRLEAKALVQQLSDQAITVLKNENIIPLRNDFVRKTAIVTVGPSGESLLAKKLKENNPQNMLFILPKDASKADIDAVKNELANYSQVILAIYDTRIRPQSAIDYNPELKQFIASTCTLNTVSIVFANPYAITTLPNIEKSKGLLVGYQNLPEMEIAASKVLFGLMKAQGKLPVTINRFFKYGDGM
ncbi:MAG: glycoside hydrolase family 3 [Sphingobacteriales bacterium]|nr:glycoside hydrolase family 3 [Sphingobacteriales bacterium]